MNSSVMIMLIRLLCLLLLLPVITGSSSSSSLFMISDHQQQMNVSPITQQHNNVHYGNITQKKLANDLLNHAIEWLMMNKKVAESWYTIVNNIKFNNSLIITNNQDEHCFQLLNITFTNPLYSEWSTKLIDSTSSLFRSGLFSGTYTSFGDFDSCLDIEAIVNEVQFVGQYCFATIRIPGSHNDDYGYKSDDYYNDNNRNYMNNDKTTNFQWKETVLRQWLNANYRFPIANGICLPSVCRREFVRGLIQNAFPLLNKVDFDINFCQTKNQTSFAEWSYTKLVTGIIFGCILSFTILGTILEFCLKQQTSQTFFMVKFLCCFSLLSNIRSLFVVKKQSEYPWINGWRVLLTTVVLICHVSINHGILQLSPLSPYGHYPKNLQDLTVSISSRGLVNSIWSIKSFFMLGGFLMATSFWRTKHHRSFMGYLIARWIRFTPTLIGYIIVTFIFAFIGNGPLFHEKMIEPYIKPCLYELPYHLLYVNNWLDFRKMCGFQTWYLSVDFQLYIMALLVLFLHYNKFTNIANVLTFIFILASYIILLFVFIFKIQGIPYFLSLLYPQLPLPERGFLLYWTATYNHIEAYFVGIIVGTLVGKKIPYNLSKAFIRNMLLFCQIVLFLLPQLIYPLFLRPVKIVELIGSYSWFDSLLMSTSNLLWLLCISVIFYLASTYRNIAKTNIVLKVLSSGHFVPWARLSFTCYLLHVPVTWFIMHQARKVQMENMFSTYQLCLLVFMNTFLISLVVHLLFELPFSKLYSLYSTNKMSSDFRSGNNNNNNNNSRRQKTQLTLNEQQQTTTSLNMTANH